MLHDAAEAKAGLAQDRGGLLGQRRGEGQQQGLLAIVTRLGLAVEGAATKGGPLLDLAASSAPSRSESRAPVKGIAVEIEQAGLLDQTGNRTLVTDAEAWGETWRAHQDRYFAEHGIELRVDATAAHPGEHISPVRMRKVDSPAVKRAEALRTTNEAAARDRSRCWRR